MIEGVGRRTVQNQIQVHSSFKVLDSRLEIERLLQEASLGGAKGDLRLGTQDAERLQCRTLEPSSFQKGVLLSLPDHFPEELIKEATDGPVVVNCLAILFLKGHALLGIRPTSVQLENGNLRLHVPCRYFIMQRRTEARYEIPRGYSFEIGVLSSRRRLLDISLSGLAFQMASEEEAKRLKVGTYLKDVALDIPGGSVKVELEVASVIPLKMDPKVSGYKVGCKIIDPSPTAADLIASFVVSKLSGF
jgi:hypothetical protein